MNELISAFSLGNAAILTNSCLLPLYPGLIAYLAGNTNSTHSKKLMTLLGVLVLAGVMSTMLIFGLVLSLIIEATSRSVSGQIFPVLLTIIYSTVIIMGIMMLRGFNPFVKMSRAQAPLMKNPFIGAYVYGLFFGPMTLPCTGPLMIGTFAMSASVGDFADSMLFFVAFALGFGWPLVVLPLLALPFQRQLIGWLTRHHLALTRVSGVLLLAIGVFGILTEFVPHLAKDFYFETEAQLLYWIVVGMLAIGIGYWTHHQDETQELGEVSL